MSTKTWSHFLLIMVIPLGLYITRYFRFLQCTLGKPKIYIYLIHFPFKIKIFCYNKVSFQSKKAKIDHWKCKKNITYLKIKDISMSPGTASIRMCLCMNSSRLLLYGREAYGSKAELRIRVDIDQIRTQHP